MRLVADLGAGPGMESSTVELALSPLDALHRALGARMVPFAGYAMPLSYPSGILAEHRACRTHAALFDVSHMGQAELLGAGGDAALEHLVPGDLLGLKRGHQRYTLLTGHAGGILDDLMVARLAPERLFLVVNAANKAADFARISAHIPAEIQIKPRTTHALLAFQGPRAAGLLGEISQGFTALPFMGVAEGEIAGISCLVSRSGYTGEDGFEISVAGADAEALARRLLALPGVVPAGLGARDVLRLEAGLCLHGQDIDATTTPVEADLAWTIAKRRRATADFPGARPILEALVAGPARLRIGLRLEGRAPARAGAPILAAGEDIGHLTSGGFSPSLNAPIGMGYVVTPAPEPGAPLAVRVRGQDLPAHRVTLPFIPHRYAN